MIGWLNDWFNEANKADHDYSTRFDSSIISHHVNIQCAEDVTTFIPYLSE